MAPGSHLLQPAVYEHDGSPLTVNSRWPTVTLPATTLSEGEEEKLGNLNSFNWRTWQRLLTNAGSSTGHAPSDLREELSAVWITGSLGVFEEVFVALLSLIFIYLFLFNHAAQKREKLPSNRLTSYEQCMTERESLGAGEHLSAETKTCCTVVVCR